MNTCRSEQMRVEIKSWKIFFIHTVCSPVLCNTYVYNLMYVSLVRGGIGSSLE